jgi:hypothetical protein
MGLTEITTIFNRLKDLKFQLGFLLDVEKLLKDDYLDVPTRITMF